MRITRTKFLSIVVQDVDRGVRPGYRYSTNSLVEGDSEMRDVWSLYRGNKGFYGFHDTEAGGVTMVLHRPHQSTYVHTANLDEVVSTLSNHEEMFSKFVAIDEATGDYLSSDEGAWGR